MYIFLLFPLLFFTFQHRKQNGSLIAKTGQCHGRILDTSSTKLPFPQIFHHILKIKYQINAYFCIFTDAHICFPVYPSFHTDIRIGCHTGSFEIWCIITVLKLFIDVHISAHLDPDSFSIFFFKLTKIRCFILCNELMLCIGFFHIF